MSQGEVEGELSDKTGQGAEIDAGGVNGGFKVQLQGQVHVLVRGIRKSHTN